MKILSLLACLLTFGCYQEDTETPTTPSMECVDVNMERTGYKIIRCRDTSTRGLATSFCYIMRAAYTEEIDEKGVGRGGWKVENSISCVR